MAEITDTTTWDQTTNGQDTNNAWEYLIAVFGTGLPDLVTQFDTLANQPL